MALPQDLTPEMWRRIGAVLDQLRDSGAGTPSPHLDELCAAEGISVGDVEPFLQSTNPDDRFLEEIDSALLADCARDLTANDTAALGAGDRLGPYEVIDLLGIGGMGTVYRGLDTRLDRPVAVKLLQSHFAGRADSRRRFEQEARAISALNHPNICTLFDVGEIVVPAGEDADSRTTPYLVMELLDGETLADRLRRGPLPLAQAIDCVAQIADALAAAHRQGVVHRDLKPANIMVTPRGVKLLDFGIAALGRPGRGPMEPASEHDVIGTLEYMAPEQLAGGAGDARSDIFALGAVAYEVFTGRKAFSGETTAEVATAVQERNVPLLTAERPGVPAAIAWAIDRSLAKDPEQRWQSAADLATHLRWSGSPSNATPQKLPVRSRQWLALAGGLSVVAAGAAALFFQTPAANPAQEQVVRYEIPPPDGTTFDRTLALSPDGRRIAFTATNAEGHRTLWIRPLDAVTSQEIANSGAAFYPFWSPDGRHVGFFADQKLKKVELATGLVHVICNTGFGGGGTWNRDDVIVFGTQSTTTPSLLQRVSAAGGVPIPITQPRVAQTLHAWPQFLPDGRHFLYMRLEMPEDSGIFVGSLGVETYEPLITTAFESRKVGRALREAGKVVGRARVADDYLFFVRAGSLWAQALDPQNFKLTGEPTRIADDIVQDSPGRAAFDVSATGVIVYRSRSAGGMNQLTWFDRSGKESGRVGEPGPYGRPVLSPDARSILVDHADSPGAIVRIDAVGGAPTDVIKSGMVPIWSPDGMEMLFRGGGGPIVSAAKIDGSEPEGRLVGPSFNAWPGQWLKDGRFLGTAIRTETTSWDIFVKTVVKGDPTFLVATTADETDPRVSPDGRWLAYAARDESGQFQLFVRPFERPGRIERVSLHGGRFPRWNQSGNQLCFVRPDGTMMRGRVETGQEFRVKAIEEIFRHEALSERFSASLDSPYDLAPDGRFVLSLSVTRPKVEPLSVLLNWHALVKK